MAVIWVGPDAKIEEARYRNRIRREIKDTTTNTNTTNNTTIPSSYITGDGYDDESFLDLWLRFEAPDERNRWDSPLYRVTGIHTPEYSLSLLSTENTTLNSNSTTTNNKTTNLAGPFFTSKFELNKIYTASDLVEASAAGNLVGNNTNNSTTIKNSQKFGKFRNLTNDNTNDNFNDYDIDVANLADFDNIDLQDDDFLDEDGLKDNHIQHNNSTTSNIITMLPAPITATNTATAVTATTTNASLTTATVPKKSAFRKGVAGGTSNSTPTVTTNISNTNTVPTIPTSNSDGSLLSSPTTNLPSSTPITTTNNTTLPPSTNLPNLNLLPWSDTCITIYNQIIKGGKILRPALATKSIPSLSVDFLFELETRTSEVIAYIAKEILGSTTGTSLTGGNIGGLGYTLSIPGSTSALSINKKPTLLQLKRMQRTFIKISTDINLALVNSGDGEIASGKIMNTLLTKPDTTNDINNNNNKTILTSNTGDSNNNTVSNTKDKESWGKVFGDVESIKRRFVEYLNISLRDT